MREKVIEKMHIIDTAKEAMISLGIEPQTFPVRGGTDGARLSYMGLVTPNLFTGGANFHGKFEYIVKESMESAVKVIVKILELYAK
jgi:tripeptide aminopeptidase